MLAIIRCLEEWDAELRGVGRFDICTDHKNLEYFMTVRRLTERQMRWSLILSRYDFRIVHVPGRLNERADALSRRDQDMPKGEDDERISDRKMRLLRPEVLVASHVVRSLNKDPDDDEVAESNDENVVGELPKELEQWDSAIANDMQYIRAREAVENKNSKFPTDLDLKVSISECSCSEQDRLQFRGREWVPRDDNLRTSIIQTTHDSPLSGHPGREVTYANIARQFFWPGMAKDIRRFIENCDSCGRNKSWRSRRQGFLKPLPIPGRVWTEISMDFITELPCSKGCTNMIVITDRLSKGVIADGLEKIDSKFVAKWFIKNYLPHHFLPTAIVSDRGSQFTSALWNRVCDVLGIQRRLSTGFSPETDGATERMNEVIETTLRQYVNWEQNNWVEWFPVVVSSICGRNSGSTGTNAFYMTHGWDQNVIEGLNSELSEEKTRKSPVARADKILNKLKQVREWAQASMAAAQESQERQTNRRRDQAPSFKIGDKVWLSLENIKTDRPCKKLDARYAKFTVIGVVGSHSFRLDISPGIHNVFHSKLLKPANSSRMPGQIIDDNQPSPKLIDGVHEYELEQILDQKKAPGKGKHLKYLVKWVGYARPTWEPESFLKDTTALYEGEKLSRSEKMKFKRTKKPRGGIM
ncbi:hypothetical protein K3495_g5518 [Podosphaera aphanis]|nr:hypothetical protein K3495_g5518 [Podosphaera aphanis]